MADLLYEPDIAVNASKSVTPKILRVDFGDGYTQRADDGINNIKEEWSVTWKLEMTEANLLESFLEAHGADSFTWTPPGESTKYFITKSWSSTPIGSLAKQMSATFERVFD